VTSGSFRHVTPGQLNAMLYVPEVKLSTLVGYYSTLALRLRIFRVDAH
jgi:hypothetical protein